MTLPVRPLPPAPPPLRDGFGRPVSPRITRRDYFTGLRPLLIACLITGLTYAGAIIYWVAAR